MLDLICPNCKSGLSRESGGAVCGRCGSIYEESNGIIRFVKADNFYEGRFGAGRGNTNNVLELARKIYSAIAVSVEGLRVEHERLYKKLKSNKRKINVLDIGCGGGKTSLKPSVNYYVVGLDLSLSSLFNAKKIYDEVYCASAFSMPFGDNTFDCVCSFDLMGHIPLEKKELFISEVRRVLKLAGLTFHYIEVDSPKGYNNWAKKYPSLYQRHFVDLEGHIGLEYYKNVMQRFERNGFELLRHKGIAKFVLPPGEFSKRFNNEYKKKNALIKALALLDGLIASNTMTKVLSGIMLKPFSLFLDPLISDDYSGLLYVAFKKE